MIRSGFYLRGGPKFSPQARTDSWTGPMRRGPSLMCVWPGLLVPVRVMWAVLFQTRRWIRTWCSRPWTGSARTTWQSCADPLSPRTAPSPRAWWRAWGGSRSTAGPWSPWCPASPPSTITTTSTPRHQETGTGPSWRWVGTVTPPVADLF